MRARLATRGPARRGAIARARSPSLVIVSVAMRSRDTTPEAHAFQMAVYRKMTTRQRFGAAVELADTARRLSLDGIRARHPEYDEHTAVRALFRLLHGDALHDKVWPGLPAPAL